MSKEEFLACFSATDDATKGHAEFLYNNRFDNESLTSLIEILKPLITEAQIRCIKELREALERFPEEQRSGAFLALVDAIKEVPDIAPLVLCIKDWPKLRMVVNRLTDFPERIEIINDFLSIYEINRDKVVVALCTLMEHVYTTNALGFVMIQRFASGALLPDRNLHFINLINSEIYIRWFRGLAKKKTLSLMEYDMMIEIAAILSKEQYIDPDIDFLTCSLPLEASLELYTLLFEYLKYLVPLTESIRIITSKLEAIDTIKEIDLHFIKWLIISLHPYFDDKKRLIEEFFPLGVNTDELPKVICGLAYINSNYSHLMLGCIYFFYCNSPRLAKFFLEKIPESATVCYTQAQLLLASIAFLKNDFSRARDFLEDTTVTDTDRTEMGAMISTRAAEEDELSGLFMAGLLREGAASAASLGRRGRMPDLLFFKGRDGRGDSDDTTTEADATDLAETEAMVPYKP